MKKGAENAVRQCMGVSEGETVLVITDEERRAIGRAIEAAASEVAEVLYVEMEADEEHGAEPLPPLAAAMRESDVVIVPTTRSLTHTRARQEACRAGARVATMPGITEEVMEGAMEADYRRVAERAEELYESVVDASEVRVTSPQGTDLILEVEGRHWEVDDGLCHQPGCYTNLPAGEVFVSPNTGSGSLVVDGSMAGVGMLEEPARLEFEDGEAVEIGHDLLRERVERAGECGRHLAELGIGLNYAAELIGNVLQDEKVGGTVHVAIGDDTGFGGDVECPLHVDGVLKEPAVEVDGEPLDLA